MQEQAILKEGLIATVLSTIIILLTFFGYLVMIFSALFVFDAAGIIIIRYADRKGMLPS